MNGLVSVPLTRQHADLLDGLLIREGDNIGSAEENTIVSIIASIREQTPNLPAGIGAVVEDDEGLRYTRAKLDADCHPNDCAWFRCQGKRSAAWVDTDTVATLTTRVLSKGGQS